MKVLTPIWFQLRQYSEAALFRNAAYYVLSVAVAQGSGFFFWIIATRLYSPAEMGFSSASISATMLVATLATMGLTHALVRYLPGAGPTAPALINTALTLATSICSLLGGIFILGLRLWAPALGELGASLTLVVLFLLFTLGATFNIVLLNLFMAYRRGSLALVVGILNSLLKLFLVVVLAFYPTAWHTFDIFIAWGIALALPNLVALLFCIAIVQPGYRPQITLHGKTISSMFRFYAANCIGELSWFSPTSGVLGWLLVLVMVNLIGAQQNAYFYVAWLMATFFNTIPVAMATSLLAEGAHGDETIHLQAWHSLKMSLMLLVPLNIVVLLVGDKALVVFFGPEYAMHAAGLLKILAVATLPLAFNAITITIWRVERRLSMIVALSLIIAASTVGLTLVLTPFLGILGPGLAWLAAQILGFVSLGRIPAQQRLSRKGL